MPARSPLSPDDEVRLLRHLNTAPIRDRCLVLLAHRTGLRAIELSRITVGQVHDGHRPRSALAIPRRDLKGGRGVRRKSVSGRVIPLGPGVRSTIAEYVSARFAGRLVATTDPFSGAANLVFHSNRGHQRPGETRDEISRMRAAFRRFAQFAEELCPTPLRPKRSRYCPHAKSLWTLPHRHDRLLSFHLVRGGHDGNSRLGGCVTSRANESACLVVFRFLG